MPECAKSRQGGVFADLTFGGGGHSRAILSANSSNSLLAMDYDPDASIRAESFSGELVIVFVFVITLSVNGSLLAGR